MFDKVMAIVSWTLFAAFLAILGIWVESVSIKVVLIITALMCAYDFWRDVFAAKNNGNGNGGRH